MPKSTNSLTEAQVKKAREIHKQVLDENTTLRRIVEDAIAGTRGEERQKAWGKAVRIILRRNALYRAAVRDKFNAAGIPTAPG
jgi:hypothetical protein